MPSSSSSPWLAHLKQAHRPLAPAHSSAALSRSLGKHAAFTAWQTTHTLSSVHLLGAHLRGFLRTLFFASSVRTARYCPSLKEQWVTVHREQSRPNLALGLFISWGTPVPLHVYSPHQWDQPGSEAVLAAASEQQCPSSSSKLSRESRA